jgi:hypothetical protein
MITQIIIPIPDLYNNYNGSCEDFTFSGKFPSKQEVVDYIKILIKTYPNVKRIYSQCLKIIRAIKQWPVYKNTKPPAILSTGSVEFEKDITIMQMIDSPFDKNIGITIIWKILNPCLIKRK